MGTPKNIRFADDLGFETTNYPEELGLALGQAEVTPLEMAFVAMLANGGTQVYGQPVTHAIDQNGENHIYITGLGGRILDESTAALTRDIMRLVIYKEPVASRGALGERIYRQCFWKNWNDGQQ